MPAPKVTPIPVPSDIHTRRVSVEMTEAEWVLMKRAARYYADAAPITAGAYDARDAIHRANFDWAGFYSIDFNRCFVNDTQDPELTTSEKDMVARGDMIGAIKSLRSRLNLSLKDAKDIVDRYRNL